MIPPPLAPIPQDGFNYRKCDFSAPDYRGLQAHIYNKIVSKIRIIEVNDFEDDNIEHEIQSLPAQKPFQCAICDKTFNDNEEIDAHCESHGNNKSSIKLMRKINAQS